MSNKLVLILQYTAFLRNIWEDWTRKIECMCKRQTKDVRKHIKWASTAVFPAVVLGFHLISVLYHQDNAEQFDFKVLFSHLRPKVLSCLNIPTPAAFFQPLYNLHNGNFKVRCSIDFLCSSVKGRVDLFLGPIVLPPEQCYQHMALVFLGVHGFLVFFLQILTTPSEQLLPL